jgi:kynurenine formamidase
MLPIETQPAAADMIASANKTREIPVRRMTVPLNRNDSPPAYGYNRAPDARALQCVAGRRRFMPGLIDLSHTIHDGLVTFKGLPAPVICDYLSRADSRRNYAGGTEFQIGRIDMVSNTGTYIDCPFHRYADGKDLSETALERFVNLPAVVVRVDHRARIEVQANDFENVDVFGKAVLVDTGWSAYWKTEQYFENHSFLTAEAAERLRDRGAVLVGIDSHNIDDTRTRNSRPVHTTLLRDEILIVEHLRGLERLPERGFTFSAVPPKLKGVGTFPVRAFAQVP